MNAERQEKWVCVAAVAAAHGVRGALRLKSFTERLEDVAAYGPVHDSAGRKLFSLKIIGSAKGGVIVQADGVDDRNKADALRGTELFVPRSALPDTDDDEFYYSDLEGLDAFDADGDRLGKVKRIFNHGAGDVIEISDDAGQSYAVPFDRTSVPVIDLEAGRIEIARRSELVAEAGR